MDVRKVVNFCDCFVICSATSTRRAKAISEEIQERLKKEGQRLKHIEGAGEALWILLDYGDVVAHVFYEETRRFYGLERLWGDAARLEFPKRTKRAKVKKPKKRK